MLGVAGQHQRQLDPAGGERRPGGAGGRSSIAGSPPTPTSSSRRAGGHGSPARRCATVRLTPRQRCRGRVATQSVQGQPARQGSPSRRPQRPFEAERREAALARIEAELERIRQGRERDARKKNRKGEDAHRLAECALRDHVSLGRWLRHLRGASSSTAKVAAEERLDGKYLLSTSDPDLSAEDVAAEPPRSRTRLP